jgi:FMN phosphatase YigB (HAD superfamily)
MEDTWLWRTGEPADPSPVVVFDMDGVLTDSAHRQHLLEDDTTDWDAFFAACDGDAEITEWCQILRVVDPAVGVVLLTSRPVAVRPQTLAWLERTGVRWDLLIMRRSRDEMDSRTFKKGEAERLLDAGFDIRVVFDDDRRNIDAFHELGLTAVYVHSGYYPP